MACMLCGGKFCYVLREEEDGRCVLLSVAYVQGIMTGELMRFYEAQEEGAPEARDFVVQ
jgi:hypothetical protein